MIERNLLTIEVVNYHGVGTLVLTDRSRRLISNSSRPPLKAAKKVLQTAKQQIRQND